MRHLCALCDTNIEDLVLMAKDSTRGSINKRMTVVHRCIRTPNIVLSVRPDTIFRLAANLMHAGARRPRSQKSCFYFQIKMTFSQAKAQMVLSHIKASSMSWVKKLGNLNYQLRDRYAYCTTCTLDTSTYDIRYMHYSS